MTTLLSQGSSFSVGLASSIFGFFLSAAFLPHVHMAKGNEEAASPVMLPKWDLQWTCLSYTLCNVSLNVSDVLMQKQTIMGFVLCLFFFFNFLLLFFFLNSRWVAVHCKTLFWKRQCEDRIKSCSVMNILKSSCKRKLLNCGFFFFWKKKNV